MPLGSPDCEQILNYFFFAFVLTASLVLLSFLTSWVGALTADFAAGFATGFSVFWVLLSFLLNWVRGLALDFVLVFALVFAWLSEAADGVLPFVWF